MEQFQISPESFRSKMQIPENLRKQYDVAVRAGLRFMFDDGMREATLEYMEGDAVVPEKIAEGVSAVVMLIAHAVDVAQKAGIEVDNNDVAEGMAAFIENILKQAGATPEQMQQMLGGVDSGAQAPGV